MVLDIVSAILRFILRILPKSLHAKIKNFREEIKILPDEVDPHFSWFDPSTSEPDSFYVFLIEKFKIMKKNIFSWVIYSPVVWIIIIFFAIGDFILIYYFPVFFFTFLLLIFTSSTFRYFWPEYAKTKPKLKPEESLWDKNWDFISEVMFVNIIYLHVVMAIFSL